jgi:hypothetical protein
VAEFGGQLGFVEVPDEFWVAAGVGVLEAAFCCGQCAVAAWGVSGAGERAGFHAQELGLGPRCFKIPNGELRAWRSDFAAWLESLKERVA